MANYMNHLLCWIPRLTRTQASKFGSTYAIIIETLRYTRARDHGFYAAREGRGDRPRIGGSVATGGQRAVSAARTGPNRT
jgi:hypothetical protein